MHQQSLEGGDKMKREWILITADSICPLEIRRTTREVDRCLRFYNNPLLVVISQPLGIFLIEVDKREKVKGT